MTTLQSQALDDVAKGLFSRIDDAKLRRMATNCLMSTFDTTAQWTDEEDPFIITGDIPAMWLRDSSSQVEPYVRFISKDETLRALIQGVIRRQSFYILEDAYANAFNRHPNDAQGFPIDRTEKNAWVYERKFEVDSLCHPLRLWWMYWRVSGDRSLFTENLRAAFLRILEVFETEQNHEENSPYSFERPFAPASDTLVRAGKGSSVAVTGMVWSGFRPSDDACRHHYLIPAQMFAVVCLGMMEELVHSGYSDEETLARIRRVRSAVQQGIDRYATIHHDEFGDIWAYEVDGLGHYNLMDDANVPSLLSLPFLGYCAPDDPQYLRTRRFVLSQRNPYFFSGKMGGGIGSPHTPSGSFWPIGVIMQALTSTSAAEQAACLELLVHTDAGAELMHESVDADDPTKFTRPWFAWANSLFAELVMRYLGVPQVAQVPHILGVTGTNAR